MSTTKVYHPDKPELGVVNIPLNEWAKYRATGFEFCNDPEQAMEIEREAREIRGESEEEENPEPRKTDPRLTAEEEAEQQAIQDQAVADATALADEQKPPPATETNAADEKKTTAKKK